MQVAAQSAPGLAFGNGALGRKRAISQAAGKQPMQKSLALAIVVILVTGCESQNEEVSADAMTATTRAVLEHHWETFKANDLEGVMADYTEDSILITPRRTYKGLEALRDNFVAAFDSFPTGVAPMRLNKSEGSGTSPTFSGKRPVQTPI